MQFFNVLEKNAAAAAMIFSKTYSYRATAATIFSKTYPDRVAAEITFSNTCRDRHGDRGAAAVVAAPAPP
jgi:hypothetical protein